MDQIKCVIVDDEIIAAEFLAKSVRQIPQLVLVKIFNNPIEAKEFLKTSDIFVVFLDINMADLSGMELARIAKQKVVFTTGHSDFALESWNLENVIGYLTKPIFYDDVVSVFTKRILPIFSAEQHSSKFDSDRYLHYKLDNEILKLPHEDIVFIKASRSYSTIRLTNSVKNCPIPLWELEKLLPNQTFIRVSKSMIVNKNKVIEKNKREMGLLGGFTFRISKDYLEKNNFI